MGEERFPFDTPSPWEQDIDKKLKFTLSGPPRVDATNIPFAAVDGVVRSILIDPGIEIERRGRDASNFFRDGRNRSQVSVAPCLFADQRSADGAPRKHADLLPRLEASTQGHRWRDLSETRLQ